MLLVITLNITPVFAQDIYAELKSKTWFEDNGFAGVHVVFVLDNGVMKAFRQINGSGIPVLATYIYNVRIKQNSIVLLVNIDKQKIKDSALIVYKYNAKQGLTRNGIKINIAANKPIIQLFTNNNQVIGEAIDVSTITRYNIANNMVYVNEKIYKIKPLRTQKLQYKK